MTEPTNPAAIQHLWPEMVKDFDLESFKKQVSSKQTFEEQIEIFDRYFNLFLMRSLSVRLISDRLLFSIYCGCSSCKEKGEKYSIENEQSINQYREKKFIALQKELNDIPDYVERVRHSFKYFGERYAPGVYTPYEDAPEESKVATLPKTGIDAEVWNTYVIENLNETYFYNADNPSYKKSFHYQVNQINKQLRSAIYPHEELDREIKRIRQEHGRPDLVNLNLPGLERISPHTRIGIEEFRNLVSGKPFDVLRGFASETFLLTRLEQQHAVRYLKYLEGLNKQLTSDRALPDSIMSNLLPTSYDPIITKIIRTLAKGHTSKTDYNLVDDQIKELSQEQAYALLSRINAGLQHVLTEHIKICQHPPNSCTHQQSIERAHNSITNRMLDYAPVEPESKPTNGSSILSGLNNSQTVLIIYYILKIFGLEPRKGMDVTQAAKIAHLLTGKEFTLIGNSDFYKKFKQVPNFKQDKGLIEDLEIIRLVATA